MKILIVSQHFWPENFRINDFALELIKQGHQVTVLTGLPNYPQGKLYEGFGFFKGPYRETWKGVEIVRSPIVTRGQHKGVRLVINYLSFAIISSFVGLFRLRGPFDRIFVHQTSPVFMGIPAVVYKIFHGTPVYFWVLDLWPETLVTLKIVRHNSWVVKGLNYLVKWLYRHCEKILVSSNRIRYQIIKSGVDPDKVVYFPYWAEDIFLNREFPDEKEELVEKLMPKGFRLVFTGNVGVAQGLENLVAAAKILKDHSDIKYVIIGEGHAKDKIKKLAEAEGVGEAFSFLGAYPLDYMPIFYKHSDALFVSLIKDPLFSMTIPSKVQAYMASGRPIIAALSGEGADVIGTAQCGFMAEPDDSQALADCILRLRNMPVEERERLGNRGYQFYMDKFLKRKAIEKFQSLGVSP